jgi:hypothetical protein
MNRICAQCVLILLLLFGLETISENGDETPGRFVIRILFMLGALRAFVAHAPFAPHTQHRQSHKDASGRDTSEV